MRKSRPEITPWARPAFRAYFAGQAVSRLGDGVVPVTFAIAALKTEPGGWGIPAVLLALWATRFLFLAHGGSLPDRIGRLQVMIGADLVRLLAQLFPALLFLRGDGALWQLIASAAVYGAATAYFLPAAVGLLPGVVPAALLQKANAWLDIAADTGRLIGPGLAAVLIAWGGVPLALGFDAATFVVSLATLVGLVRTIRLPKPNAIDEEEDERPVRFWDAVRILPRLPMILAAIILWVPVQLGTAAIGVLGPMIADERLGGVERWGVLAMALAAGGLLGGFVSSRVHGNRRGILTITLTMATMVAQLVALATASHLALLAGVLALGAVGATVAGVTFDTLVQLSVPPAMLSRVGAVEQTLTTAMVPIGLALAVPMSKVLGRSTFLVFLAAVVAVTWIACLSWAVRRAGAQDTVLETA